MLAWTFSRAHYIDLACILSTNFITELRILTLSLTSKLLLTIKLTVKITLTLRNPLILTRKHEKNERQNDAISVWQMRTSIYLEKLNIDVLHIFNFELLKLKVCSAAKLSLKQGYIYYKILLEHVVIFSKNIWIATIPRHKSEFTIQALIQPFNPGQC